MSMPTPGVQGNNSWGFNSAPESVKRASLGYGSGGGSGGGSAGAPVGSWGTGMYEGGGWGGGGSQRLFYKGRLESVLSISLTFPSMETKSSRKKK